MEADACTGVIPAFYPITGCFPLRIRARRKDLTTFVRPSLDKAGAARNLPNPVTGVVVLLKRDPSTVLAWGALSLVTGQTEV